MKDRLIGLLLLASSATLASSLTWAQQSPSSQPPTTQVAISATTGKEAVCEGGAEIIPSGQQSFVRKRYTRPTPKAKTKLSRQRK